VLAGVPLKLDRRRLSLREARVYLLVDLGGVLALPLAGASREALTLLEVDVANLPVTSDPLCV
jgi:hypothetical protein